MSEVLYIVANFVDVLLTVLYFAVFVRVILSWLPLDEDGPVVSFVYLITDPIVVPIRNILEHFSLFENMPVDFSPFFAMIFLILLQVVVGLFY